MVQEEKKPLVVVTGPTAVGKSALAVELAQRIGGEIISADSMQVYRHMDIGSAKITEKEMSGVLHHLIDVLDPTEEFNVVTFQQMAREAIGQIYQRGHIPILAGGTGFYIQAVLYDIDFTENDEDTSLRRALEEQARLEGPETLYERLKRIDPASCDIIHKNNVKRVIRAIEFYEMTGRRISEHNQEQRERESLYKFAYFVLCDDREKMYRKIEERVDRMVTEGLVEEVRALKKMGCTREMVSMQGLGYKEMLDYLDHEISLEEAIYRIKRDTRHFAKRQLTWFRREKEVIWIDRRNFDQSSQNMARFMQDILREKSIIMQK